MKHHLYLIVLGAMCFFCAEECPSSRIMTVFLNEENNRILKDYCDSIICNNHTTAEKRMFVLTAQNWTSPDTIITFFTVSYPFYIDSDGPIRPIQHVLEYKKHILLVVLINKSLDSAFAINKSNTTLEAKLRLDAQRASIRDNLRRENIQYFRLQNGLLTKLNTLPSFEEENSDDNDFELTDLSFSITGE